MPAVKVDPRVAATLAFCNEARARLGHNPVAQMRAGERLNPWFCPVCRTIGDGLPHRLEPEFSGTLLRVWHRHTNVIALEAEAPAEVVEWSEEFDRGRHDELATTSERARAAPA